MQRPEIPQPTPDFHAESRPDILDPDYQLRARFSGIEPVAHTKGVDAPGHIARPDVANAIDEHHRQQVADGTLDVHRRYTA